MATKLFISYRRDNAGIYARLLHQLLKERKYKVFLDTEGLEQGLFDEQLLRQIERCDYFILLLTEGALSRPFVQREVKHALDHNKKVIPIVDEQFHYPNFLPESLKMLPSYQSIKTNTADTTQVNYVVQQLQEIYLPKSRSWSKYLLIGLIPLAIFGVVVVSESSLQDDIIRVHPPLPGTPEPGRGVTTDNGGSQSNSSEQGQTTEEPEPKRGVTPPKPPVDDSQSNSSEQGQTAKEPEQEPEPPSQPPPQSFNNQETIFKNNSTFTENGKTIEGDNNKMNANNCIVRGDNNKIYGSNNTIRGNNNKIYGSNNIVHGDNNKTYGSGNHSSGDNNKDNLPLKE